MPAYSPLLRAAQSRWPALSHRDYRYYWLSQCLSQLGTWVQNIGQSWLILSLSDSPLLLGWMETARFLPITLFSLFAGVIIDRYPKRRILLLTQTASMLLAFVLAGLVFTHWVRAEAIFAVAVLLGLGHTLDLPARQSYPIELAGKADFPSAVALGAVSSNLTRIAGPALGALVLAKGGAGWCFVLNGLSYLAVVATLLRLRDQPRPPQASSTQPVRREIGDGLRYIRREPTLAPTFLAIIIVGVFLYNYSILIPVFTQTMLHQGEATFGWLLSALGVGAFLGAVLVSLRGRSGPPLPVLLGTAAAEAVLLLLCGFTRHAWLAAVCLAGCGLMNTWFDTTANAAVQLAARDEYRGRVVSVYTLVYAGTAPLGFMFTGAVTERLGVGAGFGLNAGITLSLLLLLALVWYRRRPAVKDPLAADPGLEEELA